MSHTLAWLLSCLIVLGSSGCGGGVAASPASPRGFAFAKKLVASKPEKNERLGSCIATGDEFCIAAAHYRKNQILVFSVDSTEQIGVLCPAGGNAHEEFGESLDVHGGVAIVGSPNDWFHGGEFGAAYVFELPGGRQVHRLVSTDSSSISYFGQSVAIQGNLAIVGAAVTAPSATDPEIVECVSACAYVFDLTTGEQLHTLAPSECHVGHEFGVSVDLSGEYALLGVAYLGEEERSGGSWIFDIRDGVEKHRMSPPPNVIDGAFGSSIAIEGKIAAVSASYADASRTTYGVVHLFDADAGKLRQTIIQPERAGGFGQAIAIADGRLLVGGYFSGPLAPKSAAHLYDVSSGKQIAKFAPEAPPAEMNFFANLVALSSKSVVVACDQDDTAGDDAGAVYLWRRDELPGQAEGP
jgi:hypothetical protein